MASGSSLLLSTAKEEKEADDLLASIFTLGRPIDPSEVGDVPDAPRKEERPKKKKVVVRKPLRNVSKLMNQPQEEDDDRKFKSRFFYRPSMSINTAIEAHKRSLRPKVLEIFDDEVEVRKKEYMKTLPPELAKNIQEVRDFFLDIIGPKAMAADAGITQAQEVLQRTMGAKPRSNSFGQFERMMQTAEAIKVAKFIAKYTGLPQTKVEELVNSVRPKREAMFFPQMPPQGHPNPAAEQEERRRPLKYRTNQVRNTRRKPELEDYYEED